MAIINLSGYATSIFPDQTAFNMAVRSLIENYETPLKSAVAIIKDILIKAVEDANKKLLGKLL